MAHKHSPKALAALDRIRVPDTPDVDETITLLVDYADKIEAEIGAVMVVGCAADCAAPIMRQAAALIAHQAAEMAAQPTRPDAATTTNVPLPKPSY